MSEKKTPPATSKIPLCVDEDGAVYIPASAGTLFLRATATCCRNLAGDPDYTLDDIAEVLAQEADAIECRAIARAG